MRSSLLSKKVAEIASDKQAQDILILDVRKVTKFTDYFVICTGESARQIDAIQKGITESLSKKNHPFMHAEGNSNSGWVLIDLGGVIIHIFTPKERAYYDLEGLWSKAISVIRIQ